MTSVYKGREGGEGGKGEEGSGGWKWVGGGGGWGRGWKK